MNERCDAQSAVLALVWLARHPGVHESMVRADHLRQLSNLGWVSVSRRTGVTQVTDSGLRAAESIERGLQARNHIKVQEV